MRTVLPIVVDGDPALRLVAPPVERDELLSPAFQALVYDMLHTMRSAHGVGLAAPQVAVAKRIFVLDIGRGPLIAINPTIEDAADETTFTEGCLSVPGMVGEVNRFKRLVLRALNLKGKPFVVRCAAQRPIDEYLADAIQHELDHLDGILYIDKVRNLRPVPQPAAA